MFLPQANVKLDPIRRRHRPDRQFFANGACHILAYAFLERYPDLGFVRDGSGRPRAMWAITFLSRTSTTPSTMTA